MEAIPYREGEGSLQNSFQIKIHLQKLNIHRFLISENYETITTEYAISKTLFLLL